VEQALDKEKGQLDEEWQELAKEWSQVENEKEGLATTESDMQRKEQKLMRLRDKLKTWRSRVMRKEKWCLRQETMCRTVNSQLRRFMRCMDQQNVLMRSLEYAIEQLFLKMPEGEDCEQWFEDERDAIMVNRYKLDELKKALYGAAGDQKILYDLNWSQDVSGKLQGHAASQAGGHRSSSLDSCNSNLSYLHFRYDNSYDAGECKAFGDLRDAIAAPEGAMLKAATRNNPKVHSYVTEQGNLPRYSRRSRCSYARSPRGAAARSSVRVSLRPSLRPSMQIRHSKRASQALARNSVAHRSTLWPRSMLSQVDDVDENLAEEAGSQLRHKGKESYLSDMSGAGGLQLNMDVLNPYNALSPIHDLDEGSEEAVPLRRTRQSDQIMKEISFKTLTRPTKNVYELSLVNESGSTDSQGSGHEAEEDADGDANVDFEYIRTVAEAVIEARRSVRDSVRANKPSSEYLGGQPPARHQETQASGLPMPNLDLSAYAEYEREERSKSNSR